MEIYEEQVSENDVVVLDELDECSIQVINNLRCYKALDIGQS